MKTHEYKRLVEAARAAMRFSHSPYSKFPVGAAVLTDTGRVFTGTNVENASYGLTVCAERVAIFNAVSQGESKIVAIAIACESRGGCPPCGACRQVIFEFSRAAEVLWEEGRGNLIVKSIGELLPEGFGAERL